MGTWGKRSMIGMTLLGAVLAGCSGGGGDGGAASDPPGASAAPDDAGATSAAGGAGGGAAGEAAYLESVKRFNAGKVKSDEELLADGEEVCSALASDGRVEDLAADLQKIKEEDERELAAGQITAAIPSLCPEHLPKLVEFAEDQKARQSG